MLLFIDKITYDVMRAGTAKTLEADSSHDT